MGSGPDFSFFIESKLPILLMTVHTNILNRQVLLAARPKGVPKDADFRLAASSVPSPFEGECLIQGLYLSVDPYMRGRMDDRRSYAPAVELGQVMVGGVVGRVLESRHESFQPGDFAVGDLGWQEYATAEGDNLRKVDSDSAPVSTALGILGMPGLTAYFGMLEVCHPGAGRDGRDLRSGWGRGFHCRADCEVAGLSPGGYCRK